MESILGLLGVAVLVFTNGFFVAAEFALVGARRTRITQLAAEGSASAKVAERALEQLDSYIAATQLGITLASLALGWIGEPAIAHLFEPVFSLLLPESMRETVLHTASIALAFALVTLLHIVMGELVPKSIALQRPEATTLVVVRPVTWFLILFRPIIRLMNGIGNRIARMLGFNLANEHSAVHSPEELEMLVRSSREAGYLQESEETLLRRAFDFSDIQVQEVMQPRVEVDAIDADALLGEMLTIVASHHHSRYPVYRETIDNVVGLLMTKDLLDRVIAKPDMLAHREAACDLTDILRKPLFVPESLSVDRLLRRMQESKTHLAVVLDEYGGMAGVATMEDVIELLVGDVRDEFDTDSDPAALSAGGDSLVDGLTSLTEVADRFGELSEEAESTTLGGYVAEQLNRIPAVGDSVRYGEYEVHVEAMDGMRVVRVRFVRVRPAGSADPAL